MRLIITLEAIEEADEYTPVLLSIILSNVLHYDKLHINSSVREIISKIFEDDYTNVLFARVMEDIIDGRLDGWWSEDTIKDTIKLVLDIIDSKRDNDVSIRLDSYSISSVKLSRVNLIIKFLQKEGHI